ncbi:hypothetical protein BDP67DRAFT_487445 [Colletotrichum lupini]|nr:hypothetical protein BDP67DRAFT_487445 [Colletotrichum lupini]
MTPFPNKETKTVQTRLHPQPIQPCKYTTRQACKPPAPTHWFAPPPNNLSKAFPSRTVKVPGLQLMAAFSSASDLRPIPRCSGSAAAVRQGDTNPLILIAPTDEQGSEKAISCSTLREACANRANTQLQVITHSLHPDVFPGLAARCNILYVVAFHTHGHKPIRRIYGAARWDERDVSLRNDGS